MCSGDLKGVITVRKPLVMHNVSGLPVSQPLQTYPCFDIAANISNSETWLPYQFILCFYKLWGFVLSLLPEGNECISLLSPDNMYTALRNGEPSEVLSDVQSIGRPWQILKSYDDTHLRRPTNKRCWYVDIWRPYSHHHSQMLTKQEYLNLSTSLHQS